MSKGKVRIYELSRELKLDNKDILAICEALGVAVKSHSSTISEDDADRIRAEARKAGSSAKTKIKRPVDRPVDKAVAPKKANEKTKGPNRPVRKQQILEIRRYASPDSQPDEPSSEPETGQVAANGSESDELLSPPSRPSRPTAPAPVSSAAAPASAAKPTSRSDSDDLTADDAPETPYLRPKLVQPPSRPAKPSARRSDDDARQIQLPVKRRDREEARRDSGRDAGRDTSEVGGAAKPGLSPKPSIELKRPVSRDTIRPSRESPRDTDTVTDNDDGGLSDSGSEIADLRRPSPRPPKHKAREEEDEERTESRPKSKTSKARRRSQVVIDEEEDFTDDGSGSSAGMPQVSLSLVRPPKPKSQQTQAKPAPTAKKISPRGSQTSRSQRRERRQEEEPEQPEMIVLTGSITVNDLADRMATPQTEIIKSLFFKGIATNVNQTLDLPTAKMVAEEFGIEVETTEEESEARKVTEMLDEADLENLHQRPPVVTIMGHVDHGKTSLLDYIRQAKVAQGEAGGITQHIGAYHVDLEQESGSRQIVFLDTPGHEAFTAMRARGARVTDIAILVVAADDGVRPQTIEAISHAKAAGVPIVVAINKIDKETAQPDRVKQELMEHNLVPEEWGGDTIMVPVSAITGESVDTLLEMLLLVSEVEDLHANPDRLARGTVIEAHLDKARGPVATLLVQNGTLNVGDAIVAGAVFGKVRAMIDDRGDRVESTLPSFAVEVLGLNDVPPAGEEFEVYADEKEARAAADARAVEQRQSRLQQAMASRRVTLNSLSAKAQEGDLKELNLVLKGDVQGSLEAILASLQQLPQDEVQIRVLMAAPGEITETDVDLAAASSAVIIGFNTTLAPGARQSADRLGVDIRDYEIIYKLLEDIEGAMEGLLDPEQVEEPLGQVEVRAIFPARRGTVAGCYVLSGKVTRNCRVRVERGGETLYQGNLDSLKRMKDDVREVNAGFECGIAVNGFNDWQEGDIIDAFRLVTKRRTLTPA
ncbi:translation initiation factor IF-2 [Romeria aff. gracilis LEGE 07310]|uniref:Translation initiation factor IF-2 n=1 Tax=Vasconcelosia minhoensis LEGE 07310 TaxID=915328 RepID=A0A8J7AQL3_9CYAN|nr:translation initiation factor IF-2 [Romeria gracilis]MBE9078819.1 translation initiation factor IF-2 [Romeria aff. gracilis LEGE 07310]